jgi:hypothetical protein
MSPVSPWMLREREFVSPPQEPEAPLDWSWVYSHADKEQHDHHVWVWKFRRMLDDAAVPCAQVTTIAGHSGTEDTVEGKSAI